MRGTTASHTTVFHLWFPMTLDLPVSLTMRGSRPHLDRAQPSKKDGGIRIVHLRILLSLLIYLPKSKTNSLQYES